AAPYRFIARLSSHQVEYVQKYRQEYQQYQPDGVYHRLHFSRHGFSEYHFYKREHHTRAVKCRQRQQVHYREVCRDYRHDVQEGAESRRTDFRDGGYHGDSAAGSFQTYLSCDERTERSEDLEH